MIQRILIALAALFLLAILALIVGPRFVDWNGYKGEIAAQIETLTGRSLEIDGDISLSVLPSPTLSAHSVRLANIAGGSDPDMLTLDALEAHVALMPLLQRRVQIERVTLVRPTLLFERLADGRRNWVFERPGRPGGGPHGEGGPPDIQLDNLTIEQGTIVYRGPDAAEQRMTDVDARISAESLRGPLRAEGSAEFGGVPFAFDIAAGRLVEGQRAPLGVGIEVPSAGARLAFSGGVLLGEEGASGSGRLTGHAATLAQLLTVIDGRAGAPGGPAILGQPFELSAELSGSPAQLRLDDMALELGDALAKGEATVDLSAIPRAKVKLALNRFDLDPLLGAGGDAEAPHPDGPPAGPAGFALPGGIAAQIDLSVEALTYRGSVVSKARLLATLADGQLTIGRLSGLLPGGSDATLAGRLTAAADGPRFDGTVEAGSDNLRTLLDWLDLSPPAIPRDRLRKASLTTAVVATPAAIELSEFNLRLDASQITGGVIVALPRAGVRTATAYGIGLAIDQINVDAYLPPRRGAEAADAAAEAPPPGLPVHLLAPLAGIDANVQLRVGSLTYRTQESENVRLDLTLHAGSLTLRDFSVGDFGGGRGALSGSVKNLSGAARFDLSFDFGGADAERVAQFLGFAKQPAARLGEIALAGTLSGGADDLSYDVSFAFSGVAAEGHAAGQASGFTQGFPRIDTALRVRSAAAGPLLALAGFTAAGVEELGAVSVEGSAITGADDVSYDLSMAVYGAGAQGRFKGRLTGLPADPKIDATLDIRALRPQPLLRLAGLEAPEERIGEISAAGSVAGSADNLKVDLRLGLLGGIATVKGTLEGMTPPIRFDLALAAEHPELRDLLTLVDHGAGADRPIGPVAIAAAVKGGPAAASIEDLRIEAGRSSLTGSVRLETGGARPAVAAALRGGEIDLTPLLAAGGPGGRDGGAAPIPARRSRTPIEFAMLQTIDADVDLSADAAILGDARIEQLRTRLVLRDGVLNVEKFAGRAYGGSLDLAGRLATRGVPSAEVELLASEVSVEQLVRDGGLAGQVTGPVTVSARMRTSGGSIAALIEGLSGNGTVDGTVTALAAGGGRSGSAVLGALGADVGQVRGLTDVVGDALGAFAGEPSALSGTFLIREGVVSTRDARLENPRARALMRGAANLSAWTLDLTTDVQRPEDGASPYMTVRLSGPLDAPNVRLSGRAFSNRPGGSGSAGEAGPLPLDGMLQSILPAPAPQSGSGPGIGPSPDSPSGEALPGAALADPLPGIDALDP